MNTPTNVQIINGQDGKPAFAVIPYADFVACSKNAGDPYVPRQLPRPEGRSLKEIDKLG